MQFFKTVSIACAATFIGGLGLAQTPNPAADPAAAQGYPAESVAAIVNDTVITTFDLRQRMKLMLISAGGRIPPEAMPQVQQQAMRDLIEEKLKLQEAEKYELEITDKAVNDELAGMAAQSNMSPAQLEEALVNDGVSIKSLRQQIEASIAWPELVQGRFRSRVRVSDEEIDDTLERMREDASKEQFLVSEICIPVDDPARAQEYYQGGLQLIEQMRRGVPFAVVAQQFSACTSAAVGGDLGWVRAGELPPEIDGAVRELPAGAVTNPIPSEGAFMILAVRDRRDAVVAGEPTFKIAHIAIDRSVGENAARLKVEQLSAADACSGRALRVDMGKSVGVTLLENLTLEKIAPQFRSAIDGAAVSETSPMIEAGGAYHAAYVCDKDEGLGLPSREALENRIYGRQLSRIGQQYLRDIERQSSVEVRLKEPLALNG